MLKTFLQKRLSAFGLLLIVLMFFTACVKKASSPNYFPEIGKNALTQRALDLRSNLRVLSIAPRPGYEDFSTLAYFRLGRGAVVMSAYVTNGEAGESDIQGEYPPYLAVTRRAEAVKAMADLGSEARFLNLPDIVAARDSAQVRQLWPRDSLQFKLGQFISQFRPDLILLSRDWSTATRSLSWEILRADLLAAAKKTAAATTAGATESTNGFSPWAVSRMVIDIGRNEGLAVPANERHPHWNKSYAQIGEEAAQAYASLAVQRKLWRAGGATPSYAVGYPEQAPNVKSIDEGLPWPVSQSWRGIEIQIAALTDKTLAGKTSEALPRAAALIDSVEFILAVNPTLPASERRTLLHWKNGLENLRCTLLGIEVDYTVTETVLTDQQLTDIFVNNVKGMTSDGKTEILFAGIDQKWAVNENVSQKLPLVLKQEYRLLTPKGLVYNFPPSQYPLQLTPNAKSVLMFIIHEAKSKAQSFVFRRIINLDFAPRFVAEVLTPIVRAVPDERVVIRLMNISRDGVADTVEVADSLAQSFRHPFRLSSKGATELDTLSLTWAENLKDGTYLIPVVINNAPIAQFAARKFSAGIDLTKRAGLMAGIRNSPTAEALRRLNLQFALVAPDKNFVQQIQPLNVLIIDRRALSLQPKIATLQAELNRFVERGGHLIVLAQEATTWNAKPLWEGMQLTATPQFEAAMPLQVETSQALLNKPNLLAADDWNDWLFLRGYNLVSGAALAAAAVPIRAGFDGSPLVVTTSVGQGKRTYVDLALSPQLMNIHAGAFRLLANLISL